MLQDDRKLTPTVTNPFALYGARHCDLISPISLAEMLDDEKLESQCDEVCEDIATPPRDSDET